jgi:seryl-tRNA synthetase
MTIAILGAGVLALAVAVVVEAVGSHKLNQSIEKRLDYIEKHLIPDRETLRRLDKDLSELCFKVHNLENATTACNKELMERYRDMMHNMTQVSNRMNDLETTTTAESEATKRMYAGMQNILDYNVNVARSAVSGDGKE